MASPRELQLLAELSAIASVREALARAEWQEAERHREVCEEEQGKAENKATSAYENWAAAVSSELLGASSIRYAGSLLIAEEYALAGAKKQHQAAEREAMQKGAAASLARAGAEAGSRRLARGKRRYEASREERRMGELDDLMLARRHVKG